MMVQQDPKRDRYIQQQISQLPPGWLVEPRMAAGITQYLQNLYPRPLSEQRLREFLRQYMWLNLPPNFTEDQVQRAVESYMRAYRDYHQRQGPPYLKYAGWMMLLFGLAVALFSVAGVLWLNREAFWESPAGQAVAYGAALIGIITVLLAWIRYQVLAIFRLIRLLLLLALVIGLIWIMADAGIIDLNTLLDSVPGLDRF